MKAFLRVEPPKMKRGRQVKKKIEKKVKQATVENAFNGDDEDFENFENGSQPLKWGTVNGYVNAIINFYNR
jgi:hypothetical protein